jgi:uncharacterized membrane protein
MGLLIMLLGLALFTGAHGVISMRALRASLIGRLGEPAYKAAVSLASVIGVILIGVGFARYRAAGLVDIWSPPGWARYVTVALMWPAIICIAAAYAQGNIKRVLKHPMLVGVKLWALAHLIANGDVGSILLFGVLLGWAVFDRISLKRRVDSSAVPLARGGVSNDVIAVVGGTLLYLALGFWFHPYVIGVSVFGS